MQQNVILNTRWIFCCVVNCGQYLQGTTRVFFRIGEVKFSWMLTLYIYLYIQEWLWPPTENESFLKYECFRLAINLVYNEDFQHNKAGHKSLVFKKYYISWHTLSLHTWFLLLLKNIFVQVNDFEKISLSTTLF